MNLRLFLFSLLIVILCTQCKEEEAEVCLNIYEPVCGEDGENYFNSCQARAVGVKFTEGACTFKKRAKVVRFDEGENEICTWVLQIRNFILIDDKEVYFSTDKLLGDFQQEDLAVDITYTGFSDVLYSCSSNDVEHFVLEVHVLDIVIR